MGVMSCSMGCGNIMCDSYVDEVGYVCADCQDDFIKWLRTFETVYVDSDKWITEKLLEFQSLENKTITDFDESLVRDFFYNRT